MHYGVLVFSEHNGEDIDELLAPYDENMEVEKHLVYTKKEAEEEGSKRLQDALLNWANRLERDDISEEDRKRSEGILEKLTKDDPYHYIRDDYDDEYVDEEGNLYSTYNPNSKWDWYSVGGRFGGELLRKDGEYTDEAYASELNFERDEESYKSYLRFWEIAVEDAPLEEGEEAPFVLYKKEYYLDTYKTKENFADVCSRPIFHAVVTPDGEWHEPGQMGWFSSLAEPDDTFEWNRKFYDTYLKPAIENNWHVTLVDCHI